MRSIPDDWWTYAEPAAAANRQLLRHQAILIADFEHRHSGGRRSPFWSGFLMAYREMGFWVTAGHVIDSIKRLLADPDWILRTAHVLDGRVTVGGTAALQQLPLHQMRLAGLDREGDPSEVLEGFDAGFIELPAAVLDGLCERSDVVQWFAVGDQHQIERTEGWYVVGVPGELVRFAGPSGRNDDPPVDFSTVCLPVQKLAEVPDDFWSYPDCFYGRIVSRRLGHSALGTIEGMSGGPVVAVGRAANGRAQYQVVAIQSRVSKDETCILATGIAKLLRLIDLTLDDPERAAQILTGQIADTN